MSESLERGIRPDSSFSSVTIALQSAPGRSLSLGLAHSLLEGLDEPLDVPLDDVLRDDAVRVDPLGHGLFEGGLAATAAGRGDRGVSRREDGGEGGGRGSC